MKKATDITKIKEQIKRLYQKDVSVCFTPGRNKVVKYTGVLTGAYPEIFTVQPHEKKFLGKISFAYVEVLCGEVKVAAYRSEKESGEKRV